MRFFSLPLACQILSLLAPTGAMAAESGTASPPALPGIVRSAKPLAKSGVLLSYADVVEQVRDSVVTLRIKRLRRLHDESDAFSEEEAGNPFDFRQPPSRGAGDVEEEEEDDHTDGGGSGVVITRDGLILTNAHVVHDAEKVTVRAAGQDQDLPAVVLGLDAATDIAILRVEKTDWKPATLADSSLTRPGDIALAIGSPFGLEQTITLGIISATGRGALGLIDGGMEDFIQTDAAINPGNSGGPLLDGEGRVIGINTARYWGDNIGFAIPVNLALKVAGDLLQHGTVVRGHLGVRLRELTPSLRRELALPNRAKGVVIASVEADQPAARAGFRPGDLVQSVNQRRIDNGARFRLAMASLQPGEKAEFQILRQGVQARLQATLSEPPTLAGARERENPSSEEWAPGLHVAEINPHWRLKLALPPSLSGLVVTQDYSTPTGTQRLRAGDVILAINGTPVTSHKQATQRLAELKAPTLLLKARRGSEEILAAITRKP